MKKRFFIGLYLLVSLSLGAPAQGTAQETGMREIRRAVLAGSWYPGTPDALKKMVRQALSETEVEAPRTKLRALLVPHAGYVYSGRVAAFAYKLLQDAPFKRVVMIGPSHRAAFRGVSINLQKGYQTPLGTVPVDQDLGGRLLEADPDFQWIPDAHAREHSLEIQLPFLQTVLKDFRIVPILMGRQDLKTCSKLADALVRILGTGTETLLLASTDLSHFHDSRRARALDTEFIDHVRRFDPQGLARSLASGTCEACGGGPAAATMLAAKGMGAKQAVVLKYAHSGDVTGDHGQVVGYLSAAFFGGP